MQKTFCQCSCSSTHRFWHWLDSSCRLYDSIFLTPGREMHPWHPFDKGPGGPQSRSVLGDVTKNSCPCRLSGPSRPSCCSSCHQMTCFRATLGLQPHYRTALSHQCSVATFVRRDFWAVFLRLGYAVRVRFFCDLAACSLEMATAVRYKSAAFTHGARTVPRWKRTSVRY